MSLVELLNLVGAGVFAVSGALAAGRKRLDLFGVVVIAVVTAIGGGTLRDLLLDRHPIFWTYQTEILAVILGATFFTLVYVRYRRPPERALLIADALGLALFTIGGARLAQDAGMGGVASVIMGVITGVAGGVVRDILTAEIPLVFRRGSLYATAAIAGATTYLVLDWAGVPREPAGLAGMAIVALLRFASILWGLRLPVFSLPDHPPDPVPPGPEPPGGRGS